MIKKLRIRFLLVNMLLLLLLILGVFSSIFAIMCKSQAEEAEDIIDNVFQKHSNEFELAIDNYGFPDMPEMQLYVLRPNVPKNDVNTPRGDTVYLRVDLQHEIFEIDYQFPDDDINNAALLQECVDEIFDSEDPNKMGVVDIDNLSFRYKFSKIKGLYSEYYGVVLLNRASEISYIKLLFKTLLSIGLIMLLITFLFSFFLSKWLVKPTEIAYKKQTQFVSDAAHELKTPLTVIATNVDAILSNPTDTIEEQKKWLTYIKNESIRMSNMTNNLLKLTREDQMKPISVKFNLSDVLDDICINFEVFAFEKNRELKTDIQKNIQINGDESAIRQLVTILLDNAVKYSTEYAIIDISLKKDKKTKLTISNTGSEISAEDVPHIFDRFYRSDSSRTKSTGGFGLGLSIAKKITDEHKANIFCKSANNKTSFTIEF